MVMVQTRLKVGFILPRPHDLTLMFTLMGIMSIIIPFVPGEAAEDAAVREQGDYHMPSTVPASTMLVLIVILGSVRVPLTCPSP